MNQCTVFVLLELLFFFFAGIRRSPFSHRVSHPPAVIRGVLVEADRSGS